jgi:hypothetical protein
VDWIWDNLQLILVVAGSIAVWINQHRREKNGEPADFDEDGIPDNRTPPRQDAKTLTPASRDGMDPEQEERVRRIQEEIRRKIAERRGQPAPGPLAPQPMFEEPRERPMVFREEPQVPPPLPTVREVVVTYDDGAALERQRRMEEQLAELEKQRREARRAAQAFAESGATRAATSDTQSGAARTAAVGERSLVQDLRDPRAVRRAMVLREVLGQPVALR